MTSLTHEPLRDDRETVWSKLLVREMWASLAITSMWIAVALTAIFGPDIVNTTAGGDSSRVPAGVPVAVLATIGTWVVAHYGFGRKRD
jgi:uncharacterized membrane protein (DUF485 family)